MSIRRRSRYGSGRGSESPRRIIRADLVQFNMELFYPPQVASSKTPMVVTISGSILSCLPRQLRFRIRGSKGSFIKYGLDPQEANLKLIGGRTDVGEGFGEEKEEMWGELIEARKAEQGEKGVKNDNVEFVTTKWVSSTRIFG